MAPVRYKHDSNNLRGILTATAMRKTFWTTVPNGQKYVHFLSVHIEISLPKAISNSPNQNILAPGKSLVVYGAECYKPSVFQTKIFT